MVTVDSYNSAGSVLEPLFLQLSLSQLVSSPTHFQSSCSGRDSLLDLVLSSASELVASTSVLPPLGNSDHAVISCILRMFPQTRFATSRLRRIWAYDKVDGAKLNNALVSADWSSVVTTPSIDDAWHAWKTTFLDCVNKFVPSKMVSKVKQKQP